MAINKQQQYLVIYDIADPKRLGKTHRLLKKQGLPVQYSVFSVVASGSGIKHLLQSIEEIINEKEDDVRCYALPANIDCKTIGRQYFPDDIALFSNGVARLLV
ncbi:CRISPR-associated endonuclease Cas2 [Methylomarinum sp. Ch1-1]|uniref:CRISPR-associated endoribonuclease Cas2 n=1 Tax=Methylomarinum roseum TaxID=3067653 RepID=A0AAU7NQ34_9GAMM|nr:CRISPR-associated endonuclease Cas2 [Methylomarinum sp. Ch1-1]MDP4521004.1 CRISPR-associated endonuclease Cas2 [Methylomarinum sp. Ch1-1]